MNLSNNLMDKIKNNRTIIIGISIFLFALIIRLIHLFLIRHNPLFLHPILDAIQYDQWAKEILEKDWLSRDFDFMSPGYPYFLAFIYFVFGYSVVAVSIIQFIIGSLNCVLIYLLARKVFSNFSFNRFGIKIEPTNKNIDFISILSGLLAVFYGISIFYEGLLLKAVLINFCNILVLLFLLKALENYSYKYFFFAGLILSYSSYLRPNVLIFIPFIFIWIWVSLNQIKKTKRFFSILFFTLGVFIVSLLFGIRNYSINNEFVFTSGHGGINFYIGNNEQARGIYDPLGFFMPDTRYEHEGFVIEARRLTGKNLTTMQASNFWYGQSYKFIFSQPVNWIKLEIKKFFIFWNAYEVPLNGLNYHAISNYFPIFKIPFLSFAIIAPLALLGFILLLFQNSKKILLLNFYIISNLLAALVYYISSEYRFPVVIALFISAAFAVYFLIVLMKNKSFKHLAISIFVLVIFVVMVNNTKYKIEDNGSKASFFNNLGTIYANENQYNIAVNEFRKASELSPWEPEFHINLAQAFRLSGYADSAIAQYNAVLKIKPNLEIAHLNLGDIYFQNNQSDSALNQYKYVILNDSNAFEVFNKIAIIYAKRSEFELSEVFFNKCLNINPQYSPAIENLEKINSKLLKHKNN